MALRPCSVCGNRFRGSAAAVYFFISAGPANGRYSVKLCMDCAASFVDHIDQELAKVPEDMGVAYPFTNRCLSCVLPIQNESAAVIATVYVPKEPQQQWVGSMHPTCGLPPALAHWLQNGLQAA